MKRPWLVFDGISLGAMAAVAAYTASVYDALPERIATHFDLHGAPNGWMDRSFGTWGMQTFGLVLWAVVRSSPRWLPAKGGWGERAAKSPMAAVAMLCALLLTCANLFVLTTAQDPGTPHSAVLCVLLGGFFLALSAVLPRVRRNPLVGVRTAFTMSSDENWARTHRIASYALAASGLVALASAAAHLPILGIVACAAGGFVPLLYSWVVQYRLPPET